MFDIGWSELLLIAVIAILVVGPRDLPRLMRTVGQYTSKLRSMSRELKTQFDQAVREAELDDVRKSLTDLKTPNPVKEIRDTVTKPVAELKSAVSEAGRVSDEKAKPEAPATADSAPEAPKSAAADEPVNTEMSPEKPDISAPEAADEEAETKRVASGP